MVIAGKAQNRRRPGESAFQHGQAVYCVTVSLSHCLTVSLSRPVPSAEEALPLEAGGMATTDEPDAAFPPKEIRYPPLLPSLVNGGR